MANDTNKPAENAQQGHPVKVVKSGEGDVKTKKFRANSDVSVTCYNEYGNLHTYNLKTGQEIEIADVPRNQEILSPFLTRNHLKNL